MKLHYFQLLVAILAEVAATSFLKVSDGLSKPIYVFGTIVGYAVSFYFLSQALKVIPVGVAYAVWSGVGIFAISTMGWLLFGQKLDVPAVGGIALILCGVLVMNLFSKTVGQ